MMDPLHQPPPDKGQPLGSPGAPLYPLSQDQVNKSFSTSVRGINDQSSSRHTRTSSDVQGKVQQFNRLAQESLEKKRMQEAALKRAVIGREEAENEMRRAKEQLKLVEKELQRAKRKEKELLSRCEEAETQLNQEKIYQQKCSHDYEKEIRKVNKEAFRSSSKLVALQEDLKSSRDALKAAETENENKLATIHRLAKESSANHQKAVDLQTRVTAVDERVAALENENCELKKAVEEQELLRIAAEGRLALPKDDGELLEPEKSPQDIQEQTSTGADEAVANTEVVPTETEIVQQTVIVEVERAPVRNEWGLTVEEDLREQVETLKDALNDHKETIEFMQIECQLKCCSCRISEESGHEYLYDPLAKKATFTSMVKATLEDLNNRISQGAAKLKVEGEPNLSEASHKNRLIKPMRYSGLPKCQETIIDPFAKAAPWWMNDCNPSESTTNEETAPDNKDPQWLEYLNDEETRMGEMRTQEWQEEEDRYACKQRALVIYLTKPRAETTEEELNELRKNAYERESGRAEIARNAFKEKYGKDWDTSDVTANETKAVEASVSVNDIELDSEAETKENNEEMTLVLPQHLKNVDISSQQLSESNPLSDSISTSNLHQSQTKTQTPSRSVSTPAPKAAPVLTAPPATVAHAPPSPLSNGNRAYNLPPASSILLSSFSGKIPFQAPQQQKYHQSRHQSDREERHHKRSLSAEEVSAAQNVEKPLPKMIPLRQPFEDLEPSTPKTMSREAALQAIKERRDRARSVGRKPARLF